MTPLLPLVHALGIVVAMGAVYGLVAAYMALTDRRRDAQERQRKGEADFQRTVRTDPRRSGPRANRPRGTA
ncbi:MAG TPA: hypothetical protein VN607_09360 [Gemmatimonadaceae bacterium]|nr:hypothetical protein [Gemmatimonadaceae bacterium]